MVSVLLLATFVGTVFADTATTSRTTPTLQTASTDIEVLNLVPVLVQTQCCGAALTAVLIGAANFSFPFTPTRGFVQVTSIMATVRYVLQSAPALSVITIKLNGQTSGTLPLPIFQVSNGPLVAQNLRIGTNLLDISTGAFLNLLELRLTVEYTFMA